MTGEHDQASGVAAAPHPGWVIDDRPPLMTRFFGATAVLILVGLPLMVVLAYGTLHIWSAAASDCQVFEAGDRFGVIFIFWPLFSFVLWVAYSVPILVIGRASVRIGLVVGLVVVTAIAVWFVSGTADMIRADAVDSGMSCPTGEPTWWPSILPP